VLFALLVLLAVACLRGADIAGQVICGQLLSAETERPVELGIVELRTEAGDSIASDLTDADGAFVLRAPHPGSFVLVASALGHREASDGIFELGPDGEMSVEVRIAADAVTLEEIVVEAERRGLPLKVVSSGFVRRRGANRGSRTWKRSRSIEGQRRSRSSTACPNLLPGPPSG